MNQEKMNQRINQYLDGELSPDALASFEQELLTNPRLKEELTLEIATRTSTFVAGVEDQKAQLLKRYKQQKPVVVKSLQQKNRNRYMAIAVAAAIAILLAVFLLRPDAVLQPQELYAAYYERPTVSILRDTEGLAAFKSAQLAFDKGDFVVAVRDYETALGNTAFTQREEASFFLGIALLELGKFEEALDVISPLQDSEEYHEMAEWYAALIFIKQENIKEAKSRLLSISKNPNHHYTSQAKEILENL